MLLLGSTVQSSLQKCVGDGCGVYVQSFFFFFEKWVRDGCRLLIKVLFKSVLEMVVVYMFRVFFFFFFKSGLEMVVDYWSKFSSKVCWRWFADCLYILLVWGVQIVGGMTWCITTCSVDLDVDLLFQENSTIGQKMWASPPPPSLSLSSVSVSFSSLPAFFFFFFFFFFFLSFDDQDHFCYLFH